MGLKNVGSQFFWKPKFMGIKKSGVQDILGVKCVMPGTFESKKALKGVDFLVPK